MSFTGTFSSFSAMDDIELNFPIAETSTSTGAAQTPWGMQDPALYLMDCYNDMDFSDSHHAPLVMDLARSSQQAGEASAPQIYPNTNWLDAIVPQPGSYSPSQTIYELDYDSSVSPSPSFSLSLDAESTLYEEYGDSDYSISPPPGLGIPSSDRSSSNSPPFFGSPIEQVVSNDKISTEHQASLPLVPPVSPTWSKGICIEGPRGAEAQAQSHATEPTHSLCRAGKAPAIVPSTFDSESELTEESDIDSDLEVPLPAKAQMAPAPIQRPLKRQRSIPLDSDSERDNSGEDEDFVPAINRKRSISSGKKQSAKRARKIYSDLDVEDDTGGEDFIPPKSQKPPSKEAHTTTGITSDSPTPRTGTQKHHSVSRDNSWWWEKAGTKYRCLYRGCGSICSQVYDVRRHFSDVHGAQEARDVNAGRLPLDQAFAYILDLCTQILKYLKETRGALCNEAQSMLDHLECLGPQKRMEFNELLMLKQFAMDRADSFRVFVCKYHERGPQSRELLPGKVADKDDPEAARLPWNLGPKEIFGPAACLQAFTVSHKRGDHHAKHIAGLLLGYKNRIPSKSKKPKAGTSKRRKAAV
ncbi:hypothetical protein FRB93_012045 [Tulasnella sp. JGI-2019a]|nr:hypothetical protein FRB93_012045 [Tulasnella sp. JGI-2019a]